MKKEEKKDIFDINQIEELMSHYHLWLYFYWDDYKKEIEELFEVNL